MNLIEKVKRYIAVKFGNSKNQTKRIISFWEKDGVDFEYFEKADSNEWLQVFWSADAMAKKLMNNLDKSSLLEIACGTGRHSFQLIDTVKNLYLLDSSAGALALARQRFRNYENVRYIHNPEGIGIAETALANESVSAVFSYDAMVHFEKECVQSYIADSWRILKHGSYALFHHSNYSANPGGTFTQNPGWRNYMTQELFISYATTSGFSVVESHIFSFSCPDSDCLTLLVKH
jgi:SAM-dependent methyltransferase